MSNDSIIVSVTNNGQQLINSPLPSLNRFCWTPEGFPAGTVFIVEGDIAALKIARDIIFHAIVDYGNFPRELKTIDETVLIEKGYEPTVRDRLGSDGDITYCKKTKITTTIPNLYKSIIENVTRVVDYVLISPIDYVRTEDVQHIRYINDSRDSLASVIIFTQSVPDGAGEIADGYAAVKVVNGALWFDRGFEEPQFINFTG